MRWQPQPTSPLARQLHKQLHAKDHGEPAPRLGPPGLQKGTFRSCREQMGNDSICVGFLINSKDRARNREWLCARLCSSGAEMLHWRTEKRSRAHTLCSPNAHLGLEGFTGESRPPIPLGPVTRPAGLSPCLCQLGRMVTPGCPHISTQGAATSKLQTATTSKLATLLSLFPFNSLYPRTVTLSPAQNPPTTSSGS